MGDSAEKLPPVLLEKLYKAKAQKEKWDKKLAEEAQNEDLADLQNLDDLDDDESSHQDDSCKRKSCESAGDEDKEAVAASFLAKLLESLQDSQKSLKLRNQR